MAASFVSFVRDGIFLLFSFYSYCTPKKIEFADFSVHIKLLRFPQKTAFFVFLSLPEKVTLTASHQSHFLTLWQIYTAPLSARDRRERQERQERRERRTKATTKKIAHAAMAT